MKKVKDCQNLLNVFNAFNLPILNANACRYNLLLQHGERYVLSTISDLDTELLANYLKDLYGDKWQRLYLMYTSKYDPITNTDYTETETIKDLHNDTNDFKRNATDTLSATSATNDKRTTTNTNESATNATNDTNATNSNTTNSTNENSANDNKQVHAFDGGLSPTEQNSANANASAQEVTNGNNVVKGVTKSTANESTNGNESGTTNTTNDGTNTNATSESTTNKRNQDYSRTLHKVGNIGVTTPAEMLTKELAFWQWNFYESVVNDVVKVTTLKVFN